MHLQGSKLNVETCVETNSVSPRTSCLWPFPCFPVLTVRYSHTRKRNASFFLKTKKKGKKSQSWPQPSLLSAGVQVFARVSFFTCFLLLLLLWRDRPSRSGSWLPGGSAGGSGSAGGRPGPGRRRRRRPAGGVAAGGRAAASGRVRRLPSATPTAFRRLPPAVVARIDWPLCYYRIWMVFSFSLIFFGDATRAANRNRLFINGSISFNDGVLEGHNIGLLSEYTESIIGYS